MKNVFVTMTLAALLLTSGAHATDITIKWKGTGAALGKGYLPKVASDGLQNVAIIAETGTGFSAFEDELGTYNALSTPPSVKWFGSFSSLYSPPQTTPQVGHAPSIALALIAGAPLTTIPSRCIKEAKTLEAHCGFSWGATTPTRPRGSTGPSRTCTTWATIPQLLLT
jgi:hypothetical protein